MRMSAASSSSMPMVRHQPCTAITSGLREVRLALQRVDCAVGQRRQATVTEERQPLRQLDAAGEVVAVGEQDRAAQARVAFVLAQCQPELAYSCRSNALRLAARFSPMSTTWSRVSTVSALREPFRRSLPLFRTGTGGRAAPIDR